MLFAFYLPLHTKEPVYQGAEIIRFGIGINGAALYLLMSLNLVNSRSAFNWRKTATLTCFPTFEKETVMAVAF